MLVSEGIRRGDSAVDIAKRVERFLHPERAAFRTDKPYGTDGSFDAMRLARTEITRAHAQACLVAAQRNPYADVMNYRLSLRHPKVDICDDYAANSPYPLNGRVPLPVRDTHPMCLCTVAAGVTRSPADVTNEIRAALEEARQGNLPVAITPVQARQMLADMIGRELAQLILQGVIGL
jgi:hypothetical protein